MQRIFKAKRKYIAAIGILLLMAVLVYYYLNDPSEKENLFISCTFKKATGWDCAGCGAQRSMHHLLHLDFSNAFRYNSFFVLLLPYFMVLVFYSFRYLFCGKTYPNNFWFSGKMAMIFVGLIIVFTIIRNLPFYPFTLLATPD